jgi:GGDEF domain-containing protein
MAITQFGKRVQTQSDKEIYYISDYRELDIKKVVISDGLILDYADKDACFSFLKLIRSSFIESIYLVPVFIFSLNDDVDEFTTALSDGIVKGLAEETFEGHFNMIDQRIKQLQTSDTNDLVIRMQNKILRYYYTRQKRMNSITSVKAHTGYTYPLLSLHYQNANTEDMFSLIDELENKEFIRPRYQDIVHLCSNCYSAFINYREVCSKCGSSDLTMENLIHHFVCAKVAPESDFISGNQMICPKCNKLLRHIGVDYDKPSLVYTCNSCGHHSQESVMQAACFNCNTVQGVDALIERKINNYELTVLGEEAAIGGLAPEERKETELSGFVGFSTFNIFLKYEIERIKTSGKISSIGILSLRLPTAVSNNLGVKYQSVITEVADFIKNATLATDILSFINNNTFLIVSPDNDKLRLESTLKNIQQSVQKLLDSNIEDANITVKIKAKNIDNTKSHNDLINDLLTVNQAT